MDSILSTSIVETVEAAKGSDFETIVKIYRPKVFRFILASLRDTELAENLTQDCFVRAYRAYGTFRNDCKISTWLMQIAVNLLRDYRKNRRLQFWRRLTQARNAHTQNLLSAVADEARSPEVQILLREQVQQIWNAAGGLPQKQRAVFLLRFVEDMDVPDIAVALGSKPSTVKTHLLRALTSVREALGRDL